MSKGLIYVGASIGSIIGSVIGSRLDGGSFFGAWGLILSMVGGIGGICVAYKIQQ
jgi:hypothetical protein